MRRELSIAGLSLVLYAGALVLGTLVICNTGRAGELAGEWATLGNSAHVRIEFRQTASGCLLFVCDPQVWRRVESLCRSQ
jgi:hypothetical protein